MHRITNQIFDKSVISHTHGASLFRFRSKENAVETWLTSQTTLYPELVVCSCVVKCHTSS